MQLGIPRGFFYYDYISFIRDIFDGTGVELVSGRENDENILETGNDLTVDEACFPIKLFVGQVQDLRKHCHKILIPRVMKDVKGRWLCPKLLGVSELLSDISTDEKYIVTEPLYFNDRKDLMHKLWKMCRKLGVSRGQFKSNFMYSYMELVRRAEGAVCAHVEAAWEFIPPAPREGEIILPNTKRIFLTGHCYNVYDRFANGDIMRKLDEMGIESLTERHIRADMREAAIESLGLMKTPFWECLVRILGGVLCAKNQVDGIIYLSSFSCGLDALIIEKLKKYTTDIPLMVLKLDGHRGQAGFETRLEAFADLLEKRCAS